MTSKRRSGFTLNEMLISMVILSIVGAGFTRILTYQTRYYAHQTTLRTARSVARAATNLLVSDLRIVQDSGGVDSVTVDGKLVRVLVPYRFGLVCATNGNTTTVTMLPTDSASLALSVYKGFAWRNNAGASSGRYTYVFPSEPSGVNQPVTAGTPGTCTGGTAQLRTVTVSGRAGQLLDLKSDAPSGAPVLAPVFLFQKITYSFRASGVYPNALGLWRNVEGGANEELVAPFDTSARFKFYTAGSDVSTVVPPAVSDIRGIELVLSALSPRASSSNTSKEVVKVVTSVFFKNVRAF